MRRCFCLLPYTFRQALDQGGVIVDFLNILVSLGPATHRISMICSAMVEYLYVEDQRSVALLLTNMDSRGHRNIEFLWFHKMRVSRKISVVGIRNGPCND